MELDTINALFNLVQGGGVVFVLALIVYMFFKGEILSRNVYQELSMDLVAKISAEIITSVNAILEAHREAECLSSQELHFKVDAGFKQVNERVESLEQCIARRLRKTNSPTSD